MGLGGPGGALVVALVVPGPADAWPWTPSLAPQGQRRATSSSNAGCRARGPELSAPGLAGPAISPHLQSVQLAAPRDPLGSAGAQLIQDRSTGWIGAGSRSTGNQASSQVCGRTAGFWDDMHGYC